MAVWGLSDYGRCAFGSGYLPASPTMYVKAVIIYLAPPLIAARSENMNKPPFRLEQLDHIVLRAYDMPTMQAFYCDVLGCTVERRQDELGLVQLRAGHSLIDLVSIDGKLGRYGGKGPGTEGHNMDHLCLSVAGYDETAIVAHLKAHGVRVGEIGSRYGAKGEGPSIYLFDPQGNMVELKGPPII